MPDIRITSWVAASVTLAAVMTWPAGPAAAYVCRLTPAKDAVTIKADNPYPVDTVCTVTCRWATPSGPQAVTCNQTIPGGAKGWYVCFRPVKGFGELLDGKEECRKP